MLRQGSWRRGGANWLPSSVASRHGDTIDMRLNREQILGYRRLVGHLDVRQVPGADSLRRAAGAGLTDSGPRAAVLSLHARVEQIEPDAWQDPALVQIWGPRFSAYVIADADREVFTLGRMPRSGQLRDRALEMAARLADLLGTSQMQYREAGSHLGVDPNALRYATLTGTVLLRWEGSGKPEIRMAPPPQLDEAEARRELVRRHLHFFGPSTVESFGRWAGVSPPQARLTFDELSAELESVATPVGEAVILASDGELLQTKSGPPASARLLPSGDTYYLLQGQDRELLVADSEQRSRLWTSRVWPGAVLVGGEVAGTWRRTRENVTISAWRRLTKAERASIEPEAESFPLVDQPVTVGWD